LGFLPAHAKARQKLLEGIVAERNTIIVFEAPHRITEALKDILVILGDRRIAVCREMTKIHEEVFRGTISQALSHFTMPRGEFTLVIEGMKEKIEPQMTADIEKRLRDMRRSGVPARDAISRLATEAGLSRKELYRAWLRQI
jgi:16S rRNA (cytidine1402-2'-O)-methyltransferase